jgi:hypothetical protein
MTTAALWFGSAISFALAIWPAFSSAEMLGILPRSYSGAVSQIVLERYFLFQSWCGGVALVYLLADSLYAGKPWRRRILYLAMAMLGLSLCCGLIIEPKLKRLHMEIYGQRSTPQQRRLAANSFQGWQDVLHASNGLMILGLWVHLWRITTAGAPVRFVSAGKFRG